MASGEDFFKRNVLPNIKINSVSIFVISGTEISLKQASGIGAAIFLDKAIMLIVHKKSEVSNKLEKVADAVVYDFVPNNSKDEQRVIKALQSLEKGK